jgi:hypothetical protein
MVFHIYSLLPTPCSYLWNQNPFKIYKHQTSFVRYSMLCSMIIHCSYYPHLYCLDPMLCGSLVTAAWHILSLQTEKTTSSYGG